MSIKKKKEEEISGKACFKCINWTENGEKCSCDYEYWINKEFKEAVLYVPYFFNCNEFEYNE